MARLKGNYPEGSKEEDDLIKMIARDIACGVDIEVVVDSYFDYDSTESRQEAIEVIKAWQERCEKRRKTTMAESKSKFEQFYKELEDLCERYGFTGSIDTNIHNKINVTANLYAPLGFLKKEKEV